MIKKIFNLILFVITGALFSTSFAKQIPKLLECNQTSENYFKIKKDTILSEAPFVEYLQCSHALLDPQLLKKGKSYQGTLSIPYYGGNGNYYSAGTVYQQNGLKIKLVAGQLKMGAGRVEYSVSGIPDFESPASIKVPIKLFKNQCNIILGKNDIVFFAK